MLKLPGIPQINFDEKDIFVLAFGLFILVSKFLNFSVSPFRLESLIVVFLFLLTTRGIVESIKFFPYLMIGVIGLALSMFLSPYGLLIFYITALILYKKTNLL